jgi:hypothetical protein
MAVRPKTAKEIASASNGRFAPRGDVPERALRPNAERLSMVKRHYDPGNVFSSAIPLPPDQNPAATDTPANRTAIVALVQNADILFIEAAFAGADAALARDRAHLTTTAAGEIAREANVRRVEPFHFSPRYAGDQERMLAEVMTAFSDLEPDAKT